MCVHISTERPKQLTNHFKMSPGEFPLWTHKFELGQKPRDITMGQRHWVFPATDAENLINVAEFNV